MSSPARSPGPTRRRLAGLIAIALAHGAWSIWLWLELVEARRGGAVSCALGGSACARIWDSGFANAVQEWTLLPVAGWGLVWGLVAAALPLGVRRPSGAPATQNPFWAATLAHALLGVGAVAALTWVMYRARAACSDCLLAYGMVMAYGATALAAGVVPRARAALRGAGLLLGSGLLAYLAVLYPGARTPLAPAQAALETLQRLRMPAEGSGTERQLAELLKSLDAAGLQQLADAFAGLAASPALPLRPARALIGPSHAPVRLTEFADLQCGHCADLHAALGLLRRSLDPASFAIETRYFPLDASCNPHLPGPSRSPVRCTAAKLMICSERQPWAFELAGKIFAAQAHLDESLLYELAATWVSRAALETCVRSEATEAHLRDDLDWATTIGIEGTPLVLVNGRKASTWPPFLMAVMLTGGRTDHPLLAHLPPPRPR